MENFEDVCDYSYTSSITWLYKIDISTDIARYLPLFSLNFLFTTEIILRLYKKTVLRHMS